MKFMIHGADRENGEDVQVTVSAPTLAAARQKANGMGVMVARIEAIDDAPVVIAPAAPVLAQTQPIQQGSWMQPHRMQPYAPTVNVNIPRRGNSLGVAGMIMGIVAFLICWIPFVSILSMPLSALGLLLGAIGFLVALTRGGASIGFPIASVTISGLAPVIAYGTGVVPIQAIGNAGERIARAEAQHTAALPIASGQRYDTPQLGFELGTLIVSPLKVQNPTREPSLTDDYFLVVPVTIRNRTDAKKFGGVLISGELRDDRGNTYKEIDSDRLGMLTLVVDRPTMPDVLYPGKSADTWLIFDRPVTDDVKLELTLRAWEKGAPFSKAAPYLAELRWALPERLTFP